MVAGARVGLMARTRAALEELTAKLGESSLVLVCDVTDRASVAAAAIEIRQAFGGAPDIIVNNAGVFRASPLHEMTPEDFMTSLNTNLVAPFLILREFLGEMRQRKSGHVITIGSIGDRQIFTKNAAYSASKYGLRAMHEVLRAELRGTGVRATLVSPTSVDTTLWENINTEDPELGFTPKAKMLDTESVARAVLFALTEPAIVNIDELRLSRA
jgi:NADP-dependent 3-hydroxy acid dehydrogenase YdfG